MRNNLVALMMGFVFGIGLCISGMADPSKVLAFLDVTGRWDPSLAFVMAGGLLVAGISFSRINAMTKPVCCDKFYVPTATKIDGKLIVGSALFGIGWGLAGFCPGPAVTGLAFGISKIYVFFGALVCGMIIHEWVMGKRP